MSYLYRYLIFFISYPMKKLCFLFLVFACGNVIGQNWKIASDSALYYKSKTHYRKALECGEISYNHTTYPDQQLQSLNLLIDVHETMANYYSTIKYLSEKIALLKNKKDKLSRRENFKS